MSEDAKDVQVPSREPLAGAWALLASPVEGGNFESRYRGGPCRTKTPTT